MALVIDNNINITSFRNGCQPFKFILSHLKFLYQQVLFIQCNISNCCVYITGASLVISVRQSVGLCVSYVFDRVCDIRSEY